MTFEISLKFLDVSVYPRDGQRNHKIEGKVTYNESNAKLIFFKLVKQKNANDQFKRTMPLTDKQHPVELLALFFFVLRRFDVKQK